MRSQDYFIFPPVKRLVSILGWVLMACGILCALCIACLLFFNPSHPVAETFCILQYTATVILLLMAPWCINTLMSGRGSSMIRAFGYAGILLIPIGLFLTGFSEPLKNLFKYYVHLLEGKPAFEGGYFLIKSFISVGMMQCTYICILAAVSYRYTDGYKDKGRTIYLYWIISWLVAGAIDTAFTFLAVPGSTAVLPPVIKVIAFYIQGIAQIFFWGTTAYLACQLAIAAPVIISMPRTTNRIKFTKR